MKINKTLVAALIAQGGNLRGVADRQTGRSTIQALRYIALAIENPGTVYKIADHYGTVQANRLLCDQIHKMVSQMCLRDFTFTQDTIRCDFASVID
jgi:hypothetical protein